REQAGALAVMPDHFQKIASATPKAEQMTRQRITAKHFLNLQRQAGKAASHICVACRKPYAYPAGNRDHRRLSSPRMIRSSAATSTSGSTIIRRPFPLTISSRLFPLVVREVECLASISAAGTTRASTKPASA